MISGFTSFKSRALSVAGVFALYLTLATSCLFSQEWARKMFTEFEHDFGTVAKNEKAEHVFEIKNRYEEDIRISSVKTSCACTDLELDKRLLKSNETARLIAKFNTRSFVGAKQATITVQFAPPFSGEVQVTVRGTIRSDVMFDPGVIDLGSVTQESLSSGKHSRQVQITKFNNSNWQIVDVKSTFPHVGVTLSNPMRFGNQVKYNMNVRLKETAPPGFAQGELIIVADDFGRMTDIPIKFSAKVASALQISPEVLTISTPQGSMVKKKIVVKAASQFRIKDVTCSNSSFSVNANPDKNSKVHFVNVAYSADQPPGRYEYDLEFITDLNEETVGTVRAVVEVSRNVQDE